MTVRGTRDLYTPEEHVARARELEADAAQESDVEVKFVLMRAAAQHHEHAKELTE